MFSQHLLTATVMELWREGDGDIKVPWALCILRGSV